MESGDRFAAVLKQFTLEIKFEHRRQLDALNAEISALKASMAARELPARDTQAEEPHGQLPESRREAHAERRSTFSGAQGSPGKAAAQSARAVTQAAAGGAGGGARRALREIGYSCATDASHASSRSPGAVVASVSTSSSSSSAAALEPGASRATAAGAAGGGARMARESGSSCSTYTSGISNWSPGAAAAAAGPNHRASVTVEAGVRTAVGVVRWAVRTSFRRFAIAERSKDAYEPSSSPVLAFTERLVRSWVFDLVVSVLIVLNLVGMAVEAQSACTAAAEELGHCSGHGSPDELAAVFGPVDLLFGVAFSVEIVLRIVGMRAKFFKDLMNWIDFAAVAGWILATLNPLLLSNTVFVLRVARIFRLVRLVRWFYACDAVCLMMIALKKSTWILGWASCLIGLLLMVQALLAHQILVNTYLKDRSAPLSERQQIFTYFGSFTRSLWSMFELMLADYPEIARLLSENISEWCMLLAVVHKLTIGFALVGIINAVFIQETFHVADDESEVLWRKARRARKEHKRNMRGLMQAADLDEDGRLDAAEFQQMFDNPAVKIWLEEKGLRKEDADELFDLMDDDGDGYLSVEQITAGLARLRGAAQTIDLHLLMKANRRHFEEQLLRLRGSAPATDVGGRAGGTHEKV